MLRNIILVSLLAVSFQVTDAQKVLYKDASQPVEARVKDLLSRMTPEEKIAQLRHIHSIPFKDKKVDATQFEKAFGGMSWGCIEGFNMTAANYRTTMNAVQDYMLHHTRLGIPVLPIAESLHGVIQDGATIFPQSVALGATFNVPLAHEMATAIAREAHATGIAQVLAPDADVCRELRWGRVEECFGEDPFLVARMGVAEAKAYMENGVTPTVKHFGAHSQPSGGINLASVMCGERELRSIHLYSFEKIVKEARPWSLMSSYDSWNGVPNSGSHYLLTDILRGEWGFRGYVYSDWGSIGMLNYFHHVVHSDLEAGVLALTSGLDLEASDNCYEHFAELLRQGQLDAAVVDTAVARVLRTKFALGLFDNKLPEEKAFLKTLHSEDHVALSRRVAEESIVLLKNDNQLLPLDASKLRSIAVIGPNADQVQFGDYTWSRSNQDGITLRTALEQSYGKQMTIRYAKGCTLTSLDSTGFEAARTAALQSDLSIVVVGSSSASLARDYNFSTCGEGFDLSDIELTGRQEQLVKAIERTGRPVVVVLLTGRPFAIPWVKEHVPAIVLQWYGGERQGEALADVLFGKVNPSGRLNYSFPQSTGNMPCYYNYLPSDRGYYHSPGTPEKPGRDYILSTPGALWPFGYGLSYTSYAYDRMATDRDDYGLEDTVRVKVTLHNSGERDGKEVVQLYVRDVVSSVVTPIQQLKAFSKVLLRHGESADVELKVPVSELGLYDSQMHYVVEPGAFEIQVGHASDDIRLKKTITVCHADEKELILKPTAASTDQQPATAKVVSARITAKGVVCDVQATPMQGVKVKAGGTTVTTDAKGRFSISCLSTDKLVVTAPGYATQRIAIEGRQAIQIRMVKSN